MVVRAACELLKVSRRLAGSDCRGDNPTFGQIARGEGFQATRECRVVIFSAYYNIDLVSANRLNTTTYGNEVDTSTHITYGCLLNEQRMHYRCTYSAECIEIDRDCVEDVTVIAC